MPLEINQKTTVENINIYHFNFYGVLSDNDSTYFKNYFNDCLKINPFGMIFDLSKVEDVSTQLMLSQMNYMRECENEAKKKLIASCVIFKSQKLRNLLAPLINLKQPIAPNIIVCDMNEGIEFITDNILLYNINKRKKI